MEANTTKETKMNNPAPFKGLGEKVKEGVKDVAKSVEDGNPSWRYAEVTEKAEDAYASAVDSIKRHPYYTLAGATALGFVAGFLLRRRH
ncbi:MAG: hypothetical protein COT73_05285 [Bdellovibrio sp. CG10_big_fil_rev_8_21_14_0_10_47_8]|nr:MAG: hypothetical protein COT73_05285 [Bdellovibrio sp. CG10_big_fil_rev_8_21_14_0_10_47_8]